MTTLAELRGPEDLKAMDLDTLTPIEALNRLAELKRKAGGDQ
jgi:hypothetical protein